MEKILITGGAGFIGSNLANHLSAEYDITVVDDLSMGSESNLDKSDNIHFHHESVLNTPFMTKLLTEQNFDYIFHLAAIASVADSVERPIETHDVNFNSVLTMLETLRHLPNRRLKRLVFASSAAVYGDEPTLPKQEESVIRPLTPYAIDKFAAEKFVLSYHHLYGVPTAAVRFFNVYGPNQNPSSPYSGVISILTDRFMKKVNGEDSQFTLFGDGEQTRDFVYVKDVLQALWLVATKKQALGEVYNVGTGIATSLNNLIDSMHQSLSVELPIQHEATREGDIPFSYANIEKLTSLGYQPKYTIQTGIHEYLQSF